MKTIHPAIAEHAVSDNARLQARIVELEGQLAALPQQAGPFQLPDFATGPDDSDEVASLWDHGFKRGWNSCLGAVAKAMQPAEQQPSPDVAGLAEAARIDAALSRQAEPTDTFTAVDMATAAAQGFRDGQAATVKDCLTVQPMAYAVFAANGNAVCFSTRRDHPSLVALEKEGHSVVSLAPIAQTAPQPEQSDISADRAYRNGLQQGYNLGSIGDHARFQAVMNSYSREIQRAGG